VWLLLITPSKEYCVTYLHLTQENVGKEGTRKNCNEERKKERIVQYTIFFLCFFIFVSLFGQSALRHNILKAYFHLSSLDLFPALGKK
jgi:hypothetical protein